MFYKTQESFRLSQWWKHFCWDHEWIVPFFSVLCFILAYAGIIIFSIYLGLDTTEPKEVTKVYKTKIAIEKINGLRDTFTISGNDTIEISFTSFSGLLKIHEKGENFLGISCDVEKKIEGVKSFSIIK